MGTEITRASDTDRNRYVEHLSFLFAEGFIKTRAEAEELRDQILGARSVKVLNDALSGFPLPPMPRQRRDWGVPERWVPLTIGMGVAGALIATVPTSALAHNGSDIANALTAVFLTVGILIVVAAIITACCAYTRWDNIGQFERDSRREKDRNRRSQARKR